MDPVFMFSWLTVMFTVYMYLSGMSTVTLLFRVRSTSNISFVPFLTTAINILMWGTYGYLCQDCAIIIVNAVGFLVQLAYICIYIYFTQNKLRPVQQAIAGIAFLIALYIYISHFVPSRASALKQVGLVASIFTILMFVAPICDMVHCIRAKSAKTISASLSVATLIAASIWLSYGILIHDTFISLPNIPGVLTSISRLLILCKFNGRDDEEDDIYYPSSSSSLSSSSSSSSSPV